MIKNKKFLYLAIIFFFLSIALNIPFPNKTLKGKESELVKIDTNIDVSKIKKHSYGGEMTGGVPIIIKSGAKSRNL